MQKIIFLVGPTGIGKSETAVYLAKKLNAEIISCDSMQIYRGMDILTSKPPKKLTSRVKHYLINSTSPGKEYNVALYRKDALEAMEKIYKKGKLPLFVGGTGLYMSIVVDGLFKAMPEDKALRRRLMREAQSKGNGPLYLKLRRVDPQSGRKIHPNDTKRIVRALEVFIKSGKPISVLQRQRDGLGPEYSVKIFALNLKRDDLYRRIEKRVEKMFKVGLVKEVKRLRNLNLSRTAKYALGIREVNGYLDGKYSLEEAKRLIKLSSRHYAKRQLTWFRKDKRIKWVNIKTDDTAREVAGRICKLLGYNNSSASDSRRNYL